MSKRLPVVLVLADTVSCERKSKCHLLMAGCVYYSLITAVVRCWGAEALGRLHQCISQNSECVYVSCATTRGRQFPVHGGARVLCAFRAFSDHHTTDCMWELLCVCVCVFCRCHLTHWNSNPHQISASDVRQFESRKLAKRIKCHCVYYSLLSITHS